MQTIKKLISFLHSAREELKQVKWPTKAQTTKYTKNVIVVSILVAMFLGILDFLFNKIVTSII